MTEERWPGSNLSVACGATSPDRGGLGKTGNSEQNE